MRSVPRAPAASVAAGLSLVLASLLTQAPLAQNPTIGGRRFAAPPPPASANACGCPTAGTSRTAGTCAGRWPCRGWRIRARSSGAIGCSSRPRSAAGRMRPSSRDSTARAPRPRTDRVQRWVVMALDRRTGSVVWQQTAYEGVPREKRHIKATYANATPATDGRRVVAFFGSQGLYAFDMDGRLLWKKDLGVLNTGAYDLPEYEWGTASSPIIYKNLVIVQCDTQNESFVLAADIDTGRHGLEDGPEGAAFLGHADRVSGTRRTARRARHQRVELHPRLRPRHRRRAMAARRQLEDHRPDPGLHPRHHRRRQRPRAGTAGLRDQARRVRRHHAARRTRPRTRTCCGARPAAARTCRRR